MNQVIHKQVLDALLNLYLAVKELPDPARLGLDPFRDQKETALKALKASGILNDKGDILVSNPQYFTAFPSGDQVKESKEKYPSGTRIRLDAMPFAPLPVEVGMYGTVESVDAAGSIQMRWDNGRTLALIPDVDEFTVLTISFDDFVATRKFVDDIERAIGFDNETPGMKGYVYKGSFYIQKHDDGTLSLPLGRDEFVENEENLGKLEKILYDQHFGY